LPSHKKKSKPRGLHQKGGPPTVRPLWSGTISFGLVSIPVDLLAAVTPRNTALMMIDNEGHALGRQYYCSKERKKLTNDDLVRGYETKDGKMVVITDVEFESVAPEMSADINLRNFVPVEQIPALYFQKHYFLAPAGKSSKAYNLLVATMHRTGRVGIGNFVMRGHEYLVAIISDNGVLRADTLRYADEVRSPENIGLPKKVSPPASLVTQFIKQIMQLKNTQLEMSKLQDTEAEALKALVKTKQKNRNNVVHQSNLETDEEDGSVGGGKVIDLMSVLRRSLSKRAVVTNAAPSAPISLDDRRALKGTASKSIKKTASTRK